MAEPFPEDIGLLRGGWYVRHGKRLFDFTVALVALIIIMPAMVLLAILGLVFQGSPVFFAQERIGRFGRRFRLWKLRTMVVQSEGGGPVTIAGDERVTSWGGFLRRFKLDELPQLICVLAGSMSFVGPRPDVPGYWDMLSGRDRTLLALRPGITGPATLIFRNEESILARSTDPRAFNDQVLFPEKVRLGWRYLSEISLQSDIYWMLFTVLPAKWLRSSLANRGWTSSITGRVDPAA